MLQKRIIVCLDVRNGRTTKGIRFKNNLDIGDPVEMAANYYWQGCDELVFYDITASIEGRGIFIELLRKVAMNIFVPFCVGGGISGIEDIRRIIDAGAEKVSLNTQAVKNPSIIEEGALVFGSQCIVLAVDLLSDTSMTSGYRVVINGGRQPTSLDALEWVKEGIERGAGEVVLNSIDKDGSGQGYDIRLVRLMSEELSVPVVASGGAGRPEHLVEVFRDGGADAALIAGMVHRGNYSISEIKSELYNRGLRVRQTL